MYLLNLNTYEFEDISVSDVKFKANDAKTIIRRCKLNSNTTIVTLNCSPFTTHILTDYFNKQNYNHVFYNKNNFTPPLRGGTPPIWLGGTPAEGPMIDYTRNYLQGIILMVLLTTKSINDKDVKKLAKIWNTEGQPLLKKIADSNHLKPNLLYFK